MTPSTTPGQHVINKGYQVNTAGEMIANIIIIQTMYKYIDTTRKTMPQLASDVFELCVIVSETTLAIMTVMSSGLPPITSSPISCACSANGER